MTIHEETNDLPDVVVMALCDKYEQLANEVTENNKKIERIRTANGRLEEDVRELRRFIAEAGYENLLLYVMEETE